MSEAYTRSIAAARGRFTLLLAALFLLLLVQPLLVEEGLRGRWVGPLFFLLLLLSCLRAVYSRKRSMLVLGGAVVLMVAVDLVAPAFPRGAALQDASYVLHALFLAWVGLLILSYVLGPGGISFDRLSAAVCVYLLIGLVYAELYSLLAALRPGAFAMTAPYTAGSPNPLTYFSFVTLATLGYGDVTPVHGFARSLAFTEAIVGQLFVAILIGRLVASYIGRSAPPAGEGDAGGGAR